MSAFEGLYGGLAALADGLDVQRVGPMHQAGSDSLLTSQAYFAFVEKYSTGSSCSSFDNSKFMGDLFGIGGSLNKYKKYGSAALSTPSNGFGSEPSAQNGGSFPHSSSTPSLLSATGSQSGSTPGATSGAGSSKRAGGIASVASFSALDTARGSLAE